MFEPSKYKFRKAFKGRLQGNSMVGNTVAFGSVALKASECCRMNGRQIESARKTINRFLKRRGKLWIRIFPNVPVTKKPTDVRMGKGKGSVEFWIFRIKPGRVLFELEGIPRSQARIALEKAATKLPIKCKIVINNYGGIRH
ncbi:50S ribosomal subunit protein L16 [Candidatus Xenohaliotis californiensis]|uniref:Large ribosomal subunit protein uL16 n=1 Tax=Candidatus Xenohaliotis californiensis TaxID=84677 RepID=A0ABM9N9C4_9RICK|nr:50S ribosomal subunit protein L16 [Candidatus Xenohaliotis californiensis]